MFHFLVNNNLKVSSTLILKEILNSKDTSPPSPIPKEEEKGNNEISWDFEWSS